MKIFNAVIFAGVLCLCVNFARGDAQKLNFILKDDDSSTYVTSDTPPNWYALYDGVFVGSIASHVDSLQIAEAVNTDTSLVKIIGVMSKFINATAYQQALLKLQNSQAKCASEDSDKYGKPLSIWLIAQEVSREASHTTSVWIQNLALPYTSTPPLLHGYSLYKEHFDEVDELKFDSGSNPNTILKWMENLAEKNTAYCEGLAVINSSLPSQAN